MPCRSDYCEPSSLEIEGSKVSYLLEELVTGKFPNPDTFSNGSHPNVYNKISKTKLDELTAILCHHLQKLDVSKMSLEMQIWWRNHQAADKKRLDEEKENERLENVRKSALSKLTNEECKALNLED